MAVNKERKLAKKDLDPDHISPHPVCGAFSKRKQRECQRPAGWGTDHLGIGACKLHGGSMLPSRIAAARTMLDIEMKTGTMGANMPVDIHPTDALLELVKMTAGYVRWLNQQVGALQSIQDFNALTKTYELQVTVKALGEYTDRLARFSKMALDAGVEERLVRIAESQGDAIAMMLVDLLEALQLSPSQKALAPELVRSHLMALTQGEPVKSVFENTIETTEI